jgi:hypothetical protein
MPWPLSQDYNEAIQNPTTSFQDAELKQGEAVCNALGLPQPCSGNFADVYAVQSGSKKWAVKCFTRQIPGLQERYVHISKYLQQVNLPFMVEFSFLEKGIQVRGTWYPVLKMQWVEGFALNAFVRDNLDKPQVLQTLGQIWLRLASRLREANLAHCDLQHGNVLLVPGSKAGALSVKLVDYDGMCVPALELLKSIELGHANYQHPQRLREGSYGLQIDRFPHLAIYSAIRALSVGGKALWDRFDNGDNLLFTQKDFAAPPKASVFQELLKSSDPEVRKLTQALAQAAQKPIDQVPLLDELVETKPVTKPQAAAPAASKPATPSAEDVFAAVTGVAPVGRRTKYDAKKKSAAGVAIATGIGALVLIGGVVAFATMRGSPTSKAEVVAEVQKTQVATHESTKREQSTSREHTDTRPQVKVEPNPDPLVEPKKEPKTEPALEPKAEAKVDLLNRIDVAKDAVKGKWTIKGKTLTTPLDDIAKLQVPYTPPDEYDLALTVKRLQGSDALVIGLLAGGRRCMAEFDGYSPQHVTGLELIDGIGIFDNKLTHRGQVLQANKLFQIVCRVRRTGVAEIVDGKEIFHYKGEPNRLSPNPQWDIPNGELLFIGSNRTIFEITRFDLIKVAEPKTEPVTEPKIEPVVVDKRLPVPDADAQAGVERLIKQQLRADYAKADAAKDKRAAHLALAVKLLELAAAAEAPVERFVMLREARDLAAQAGNGASALKAVNEMGKAFAINLPQAKAEVLEVVGKKTIQTAANKLLVTEALHVLEEVLQDEDVEAAARIFKVAEAAAKSTGIVPVIASVEEWRGKVAAKEKEAAQIKAAAETLNKDPDDADANRVLGKHLCFTRGEWDKGLPLLAKASDEKLKALALKDLNHPAAAAQQIEIGDGWWDLAETKTGSVKTRLQIRAAFWYETARPSVSGPPLERLDRRLAEADKARPLSANPEVRKFTLADKVNCVAFTPDGKRLLAGGADRMLSLLDVKTGKLVASQKLANELHSLSCTADGKYAVTLDGDRLVISWEVDGLKNHRSINHGYLVAGVAVAWDNRVLTVHKDMKPSFFHAMIDPERSMSGVALPPGTNSTCGAASEEGNTVAIGTQDGVIEVSVYPQRNQVSRQQHLHGHTKEVLAVALSKDGRWLLSGSADKTARLWDAVTGQVVHVLKGHAEPVAAVALSADGRVIATGSADKTIRLWDVKSGRELSRLTRHSGAVTGLSVAADGRQLLSSSADRTVRLWDLSK